jgi:ubiquinone/menaquinone biosynthesis C-methylase UbiE
MTTEKAFNKAAAQYDQEFTDTAVGRLQRNRVWNYIGANLSSSEHTRVLELNCGTGEDAIWLSKRGFRVIATDLSPEMISVAKQKAERLHQPVQFEVCGFEEIGNKFPAGSFDLVFSDFGGLNCIDEKQIRLLAENISLLLKPGGRFIAVVMSDDCTLEKLYFKRKGDRIKAARRKQMNGIATIIENETFTTWYYSPEKFSSLMNHVFNVRKIKAVGWMIPPSYLNAYFVKRPGLLRTLNIIENTFGNMSAFARKADHFLIDMVRK